MKNKKAVAKIIVDVWAYVLFILIICFFLLIIMFAKKEVNAKIDDFKGKADADYGLMAYLRSPVPGENIGFSQLIKLLVTDKQDYELKFATKNEEIMNLIGVNQTYDWFIKIKSNSYTNTLNPDTLLDTLYKYKSKMELPSEEDITVTLYLKEK